MLGRLRPGVSIQQANAELQVVWQGFLQRVAAAAPEKSRAEVLRQRAAVLSASAGFTDLFADYSEALLLLMGIVGAGAAAGLREPVRAAAGAGRSAAA